MPESVAGQVSTKDFEEDPACTVHFPLSQPDSPHLREVELTVKAGRCGLASVASQNPRGRNHSVVLNLFHRRELSTVHDRSFIVQCFIPRRSVEHSLQTRLEVSG